MSIRRINDSIHDSIPVRAGALPRLNPAAYHGLAGDIVSAVAPCTEADPAALLISLLAAIGAVLGDGPHVMVGGSHHPVRIWPLLIGRTASGRKGESWAQTENIVTSFDSCFVAERTATGLSTGEGIIAALRDPPSADDDGGAVRDKRLLIVESEFGRTLGASRREGNTLSQALRSLWESGRAAVMTRADPLTCRGAHLVIVGHITPGELRLKLAESDIAGGLMNRFLPILVQRPQLLPDEAEAPDIRSLSADLSLRLSEARKPPFRYRRTEAAGKLWSSVYAAMAEDEEDGPLGEILARGPSYTLRLALAYAVIDGSREISTEHLMAALAVWQYAAASARHIFGQMSGRTDIDRLAAFLADAPNGHTRTEIIALFGRNKTADQIDALVNELEFRGDVTMQTEKTGKPGRPTVRAYWTGSHRDALTEVLDREQHQETA